MKKILSIMLCMVLLFSACPVQNVNAEGTEYQYYMKTTEFDGFWYDINLDIPTNTNIYAYYEPSGPSHMHICIVDDSADVYYYTPLDGECTWWRGDIDLSAITILSKSQLINRYYGGLPSSIGSVTVLNESAYTTNIPCFDSYDSFLNYLSTGNTDGWINKPEYDLSTKHDFNSDVWTPDIPVPELSKISHTGFTLENWTEDYYVDIIVHNHLSRVRMMQNASGGSTVPTVVDTAPWYSEHYWNFTLHDVLASRAVVDINEIYGVDIQGALLDDFKNWSVDYPTIKDIQGYSWTHIGQSDEYLARHVYNADSGLSDVEQLKNSGQAQTEYYVRYVTLDGKYSQWAHYRLRDYSYNGQGERVDVGRVTTGTVDNTGNTSSPITGTTDSSGNIDYTPIITTPSINTDMDFGEFLNLLETSSNVLQQFPLFLSQLFLFLPWWVNALIACAIAMCILLRIVGR